MTTPARILIVDDDPDLLRLLAIRLEGAGYEPIPAESAEKALALLAAERPAVILTDIRMGGMDGLALFDAVHRSYPSLPVIILTAHGTIPDAVAATQRGVFGYLTKPVDPKLLLDELVRAVQLSATTEHSGPGGTLDGIVTQSARMEELLAKARLVAPTEASVLILGDSGTGKELLARAIHDASPRRELAFIAINCAAIPEELLESELFGYLRGAFSGATRDHDGLFAAAHGGTLLLDEIGAMPMALQAKLLRVLQKRQVLPLGSTTARDIDVRLISASHRGLDTAVKAGTFREDLYYRLNVVTLRVPSLAERRDDIALLANHFLREIAAQYGRRINGIAPDALALLVAADWPGNVRQLRNVIEQAVALATTSLVSASLVQEAISDQAQKFTSLEEARRRFEHDYLVQLLKITAGNVTRASRLAGRNRTEFYKLLQRHKLEPAAFKKARR